MGQEFSRENLKKGIWDDDIDRNMYLDSEGAREEFEHCGLKCHVVRNRCTYTYCGYVELPDNHPDRGKRYQELNDEGAISVHGRLTYSNESTNTFGFDCNHIIKGDISPVDETRHDENPQMFPIFPAHFRHYWTLEDVCEETRRMAAQFHQRGTQE